MNVDELVRDALGEQAADVRGPNEADLFARFAHRDRVVRVRRIAVACSGLAIAVIIALVASSAAPQNRVDVSHRSPRQGRALPSRTHRQARTTKPVTSHLIAPPVTPSQPSSPISVAPPIVNIPVSVVTVPHRTSPAKTHDTTPATQPTPPTEPVTSPPAPPNFSFDHADLSYSKPGADAMFMLYGHSPVGAVITANSQYIDTVPNDATYPHLSNGWWGGGLFITKDAPVGVPFDVTFTCSCGGGPITIQLTRPS